MQANLNHIIKENNFPPVLLLFGDEEFLLNEALSQIESVLIPNEESRYDFEVLDGEDITYDRIADSCLAFPFIADKRVVIVRNFDKVIKKTKSTKNSVNQSFNDYLNNPQLSTILILESKDDTFSGLTADLQSKKNEAKALKKIQSAKFPYNIIFEKYYYIEFSKVSESNFANWIQKRFKAKAKEIEPQAVEFLKTNSNLSLRELDNEIDKIVIYYKDQEKITYNELLNVVGVSKIYNVFELQKAVGARDLTKSIMILQKLLATEKQEVLILTILSRYFLVLWKLTEAKATTSDNYKLAELCGINPYFVNEYKESCNKYNIIEIEQTLVKLTETDEKLKSSSISSLYLLEKLLIEIIDK